MKYLYLIFALICFSTCQANKFTLTQSERLEKAYYSNSQDSLSRFFEFWEKESEAIDNEEYHNLSENQKHAYQIFELFFQTLNSGNTRDSKDNGLVHMHEAYLDTKYLIIQGVLKINIVEKIYFDYDELDKYVDFYISTSKDTSLVNEYKTLQKKETVLASRIIARKIPDDFPPSSRYRLPNIISKDTITNLRPLINIEGKKNLYLTKEYERIINQYFGKMDVWVKPANSPFPPRPLKKEQNRSRFWGNGNYVSIYHGGHAGRQLVSSPYIHSISFDVNYEYANVSFRSIYRGGEAKFKKVNDKWILISSFIRTIT